MLNFENTESAFEYQSKKELKKAYFLFSLLKYPFLVKLGSILTVIAFKMGLPIKSIVKTTIFRQFCGGESIDESEDRISQLSRYNVGTILDYCVEGKENDNDFEKTKDEIIQSIIKAKENQHIPFSVFKVTGLGPSSIIRKANYHEELDDKEKLVLKSIKKRVNEICKKAHDNQVSIFIDAEDSWFQDFIDELALDMMLTYNKKSAIIFNTIQLYRHDRLHYMKNLITKCKDSGVKCGLKIVRGAYMEKEREQAKINGYEDPIHATKQDTDKDYNKAIDHCLNQIDVLSICAGTHNEFSTKYLTEKMSKLNLKNNDNRVWFAQLLGMSDHISFNLSKNGYNTAKYVPYGPIKEVLPYLIRRAKENTSVAGQTGRELSLIKKEIKRRKSGNIS